jgi:hypothetical protein
MSESKTLDRLILADLLVAVLSLSLSSLSPSPDLSRAATVLWFLVAAATVGAWVGLLFRVREARALYAASWLGYLALAAVRGTGTGSSIDAVLDLATGLVGRMILALVYFSDLRGRLRPLARVVSGTIVPAP